jgi:hypothetical protein
MSVERLPDFALDDRSDGSSPPSDSAATAKRRATCAPYPTAGTPTAPTGDWS